MPGMNICNYGVAIGRLVRPPRIYENRDGSHKVLYTLAVRRDFLNKEGKRDADFVDLEAFLPAGSPPEQSVYGKLRVGTLLAARYALSSSIYTDSGGERQYRLSLLTKSIDFMESRRAADERDAREEQRADGELPF